MSDRLAVFGRNVRLMRLSAGASQEDVAMKIGVKRSSIANMEAGRQSPPLDRLFDLADSLGCAIGVLVGEVEDERLTDVAAATAELERVEAEMRRLADERRALRKRVASATK